MFLLSSLPFTIFAYVLLSALFLYSCLLSVLCTNCLYMSVFLFFKRLPVCFLSHRNVCMFQKSFCVPVCCLSFVRFHVSKLFITIYLFFSVSLFPFASPFPSASVFQYVAAIALSFHNRSILLSDPYCRRGWTQHMFRRLRREGGEAGDASGGESGLGDKFALVLQVARRVQNQLGAVSNAAEKCKK